MWKIYESFQIRTEILFDPVILLLGIYSKHIHIHRLMYIQFDKIYTSMFIAVLSIIYNSPNMEANYIPYSRLMDTYVIWNVMQKLEK